MTNSRFKELRLSALALSATGYLLLHTACASEIGQASSQALGESSEASHDAWGIEIHHISDTVAPGDDFFTYVNQGWIRSTEMPPGYSSYTAMNALYLDTEQRVNRIVLESMASAAGSGRQQQIGDLYTSYVDVDLVESKGLAPIQEDLDQLLALSTHEGVARWMADPRSHSIVGIYIYLDSKDTSRDLVHLDQQELDQGILGLPGATYYASTEDPYPAYRASYLDYITQTFRRAGVDRASERAAHILELEAALAAVQWDQSQLRDREANYHLMARSALAEFAPGFPWDAFLEERGVADVDVVILGTDTSLKASAALFADTPVDVWRSYLAFHWIQNHADLLPDAYGQGSFDFFSTTLRGVQERRPRELRATRWVSWHLGHSIGKLYITQYFPAEHRAQVEELVEFVRSAFRKRLETVDWMDEKTRRHAVAKLEAFDVRIGYSDVWRDYSGVAIDPTDLVGNFRRIKTADWAHQLARLNGGVPRDLWWLAPQVVDAIYTPQLNAITFPAGILQPPLFNPDADVAVNFGAIAAIIGHEMGHGFDDQGARFDKYGNLRNWWTPHSRRQFESRTRLLAEQYSEFNPLPGVNLNGTQTLGENIADLTSVALAHRAYRLYLDEHEGGQAESIDGFTGDQRFFMAWAQAFRAVWSDDALRANALNSYHVPGQYRVNGVMRNIDAWYDAFDVTEDNDLYLAPQDRVRLW